jgi:hypothetical protein
MNTVDLKSTDARAGGFAGRRRKAVGLMGWGGLLATAAALAGCSAEGSGSNVPVFPVKGTVQYEGEPAAGAFVVFHPTAAGEKSERATAKVQPDGSFELTTRSQADGAAAGDYAVTVQWTKLVKQGNDTVAGPNVIPPIYAKPDTTPLKATVKDAPNQLEPFKITKK